MCVVVACAVAAKDTLVDWYLRNTTPFDPQVIIDPEPGFRGQRVDIFAGDVPVVEFLKFMAAYTGLSVVVDSNAQAGALPEDVLEQRVLARIAS